jgi:hypothetical protein
MYAIDLDACSSCTSDHLELIRELSSRQSMQFLIIGDTSAWSDDLTGLHDLDNFHFDVDKKVHRFQANFGKPIIFYLGKDEKTRRIAELKDFDFELVKAEVFRTLK